MSEFLDNLKKAADNGEFNSEAAKKILEINELADTKYRKTDDGVAYVDTPILDKLKESLEKRSEEIADPDTVKETKAVSEEDVAELNTEYEKKMAQFKKLDMINAQLATLTEIEDMVKLSIEDMFGFVDELEAKFVKEIESEDPMFGELFLKLESIKSKYKSIIN